MLFNPSTHLNKVHRTPNGARSLLEQKFHKLTKKIAKSEHTLALVLSEKSEPIAGKAHF